MIMPPTFHNSRDYDITVEEGVDWLKNRRLGINRRYPCPREQYQTAG